MVQTAVDWKRLPCVKIEYQVTHYCYGLQEIIQLMESWGKKHQLRLRGK